MNHSIYDIIRMMELYGGGFIKQLALLWQHADMDNKKRIEISFADYFKKYDDMLRIKEEKR